MGRTDQVLTGGSLSYHQLTKAMKAVLTLLLVCLVVQISSAEQEDISDAASNEPNPSLQRDVREAAKCESGDKKCLRRSRKEQKRKKERKAVRSKKGSKTPNGVKKKFTRKVLGKKKGTKGKKKNQNKKPKNKRKKQNKRTRKNQNRKGGQKKEEGE